MRATPDRIRLLHVDDDPEFAGIAADVLEREDDRFEIRTTTGTDEALAALAEGGFDCVVSDYDMPDLDGLEFLAAVRDDHPDLPFILFTGKGSEEVASEAISAGVTDYLQKRRGTEQYEILANRVRNAVSARRSTQEARRRRHRLEQILKTVPSCVVQLDLDGRFVYANDRAVEVLGLAQSDVTGRAYNDPDWRIRNLDGEPIPDAELPFRRVRDSGEPLYGFRHTIEWPDGTRKLLSVNGAPLFDDAGDVESVVFSLADVTDRRDREQRLQRSTARLEALFEDSPDMIDVHDAAGTITDSNVRLRERTGYDRAELEGMKVWDLDQSIDPETAADIWAEMAVGDRRRLDGRYRCRDGSTVPVEVHVRRLDLAGEDRFVAISRDTTDRIERERRLERRNEQLERFGRVVSHDLRNPLNVATGRVDLAREESDSDHLDAVARALERMDALIEDLLVLRENDGATDLEPVDLAAVCRDCWQTVPTGGATLVTDTDATISADRGRLRQLLENLLRNAVEHGSVDDSARADDVDGTGAADLTVTLGDLADGFYLADDGRGVAPADRERAFDDGYTTAPEGTGFGLRIVRQVADAHGWAVALTESGDSGARVEVTGVAFENG